jgi:hypothetical protein
MIGVSEEEGDLAMRTVAGVTGGCYRGDMCGAISGVCMAIAALFARASLEEVEDARLGPTIRKAYDRLKEMATQKYGSTQCSVISNCNWYDPQDVKARRIDGRRNECTRFVGECAKVLGEVLMEVVGEDELKILQGIG